MKKKAKKVSTLKELKQMFTFRPYVILGFATILNTSAVQVVQSNMELYFQYCYTAIKDYFTIAILVLLVILNILKIEIDSQNLY